MLGLGNLRRSNGGLADNMAREPMRSTPSPPAPILASGIALLAVVANAGMDTATKVVAADLGPWQGVFLRWAYAAVLLIILGLFAGRSEWRPRKLSVHGVRLCLNLIGSASLFFALAHLELWLTLTIFFLEPIFTIMFAAALFGERLGPYKMIGMVLSVFGILIVVAPQGQKDAIDLFAVAVALAGAAAWGAMHLATERMGREESSRRLVLFLAISTTSVAVVPAAVTWQPISLWHHLTMVCVAVLGTIYSYLWITALKLSSAAGIALFSYLTIPLAFFAGAIFFGEPISMRAISGSAVIILAVFLSSPQSSKWISRYFIQKRV